MANNQSCVQLEAVKLMPVRWSAFGWRRS